MACYMTNEDMAARSFSGDVASSFTAERTFKVFIDDLATPISEIAAYPGVYPWMPHPEIAGLYAQSFDCQPAESATVFSVSIKYRPAPPGQPPAVAVPPGGVGSVTFQIPGRLWTGGSESRQVPFAVDTAGKAVANSAGVPFPDATRDQYLRTLSLVSPVKDIATANAGINAALGAVNAAAWAGTAAQTWLCTSATWKHAVFEFGALGKFDYIETNFSFSYNPDTWDSEFLDIGYTQKADAASGSPSPAGDSLVPCRGASGPVTEPVALANGIQMIPPPGPGNPPVTLNFKPYKTADFVTLFGQPW